MDAHGDGPTGNAEEQGITQSLSKSEALRRVDFAPRPVISQCVVIHRREIHAEREGRELSRTSPVSMPDLSPASTRTKLSIHCV